RAMARQPLAGAQRGHHQVLGLRAVQVYDLVPVQHPEVGGLTSLACQSLEYRPGEPGQRTRTRKGVSEMEAAAPQPIALVLVLLDVALLLERREQAEDVVLVQIETLGQLGHAELLLAVERLEQAQGVADGLDRGFTLGPMHRLALWEDPLNRDAPGLEIRGGGGRSREKTPDVEPLHVGGAAVFHVSDCVSTRRRCAELGFSPIHTRKRLCFSLPCPGD